MPKKSGTLPSCYRLVESSACVSALICLCHLRFEKKKCGMPIARYPSLLWSHEGFQGCQKVWRGAGPTQRHAQRHCKWCVTPCTCSHLSLPCARLPIIILPVSLPPNCFAVCFIPQGATGLKAYPVFVCARACMSLSFISIDRRVLLCL